MRRFTQLTAGTAIGLAIALIAIIATRSMRKSRQQEPSPMPCRGGEPVCVSVQPPAPLRIEPMSDPGEVDLTGADECANIEMPESGPNGIGCEGETDEESAPSFDCLGSGSSASSKGSGIGGSGGGSLLGGSGGSSGARCGGRSASRSGGGASRQPVAADDDQVRHFEVWVIERSDPNFAVPKDVGRPTQGELRAVLPDEKREVPVPLEHTDVDARISASIATVTVVQQYRNPYDTKIEAVYVFPLPEMAAVTDFAMTIGARQIRGVIREREEAKRVYEEAKRQGYVATLLTQERPNIFTQKVANIEPGKRIDVAITYFSALAYKEGEYEFVFPMVVGPRFNPPGSTDGVGAVARGKGGTSGQKTEVQYLRPDTRSGHDVMVRVDIDAGIPIEEVESPSHAVQIEKKTDSRSLVTLTPHDTIPNKDLVLRYKVAGKQSKLGLLTSRTEKGNYFALLLQPPADLRELKRVPREMVFVLDCSGSMSGRPLEKAKEAMRRCLRKLDPNDTFLIIRFSNDSSQMASAPIPATQENIALGLRYLESLQSEGSTMMITGIRAALGFPHDTRRLRIVSFMTDGYIGNESEILAAVKANVGAARIFSFGVGSSVNRYLLERMAVMGRGAVAFVGLDESAGSAVDLFYERAARPALTDITVDWGGMKVGNLFPKCIPDLFVGRPVMLMGTFEGAGRTSIVVTGKAGTEIRRFAIDVNLDDTGSEHEGIRNLWARWKIADLSDNEICRPADELRMEITETSIAHRVLSQYTAFTAVDDSQRTAGEHGVTVSVPVPVPDGVRYETTVEEGR